nr:hypothetical protein SEVIR_2G384700v2 [Setaria viridis]
MHHECRCLMSRAAGNGTSKGAGPTWQSRYRGMASSLSTTAPPLNRSPNQPPVPVAPLSSLPTAPSRGYLLRASYLLLTGGRSPLLPGVAAQRASSSPMAAAAPSSLVRQPDGLIPARGLGAVSSSSRQPPPGAEARRSVLPSSSRRGAQRGVLLLQAWRPPPVPPPFSRMA